MTSITIQKVTKVESKDTTTMIIRVGISTTNSTIITMRIKIPTTSIMSTKMSTKITNITTEEITKAITTTKMTEEEVKVVAVEEDMASIMMEMITMVVAREVAIIKMRNTISKKKRSLLTNQETMNWL